MDTQKKVLIGDVGGTNVRLQIFKTDANQDYDHNNALKSHTYQTDEFETFYEFVEHFIKNDLDVGHHPDFAVIAIAGSIFENKTKLANTSWPEVNGNEIGTKLSVEPFVLLNDFHVLSYGILSLNSKFLQVLVQGSQDHTNQLKVVTGPGTGLGISLLLPVGSNQYRVWPTEGGHKNFAASNDIELKYQKYMMTALKKDCVQLEYCTAGPAIPYMYNFIKSLHPDQKSLIEEDLKNLSFTLEHPRLFPSSQVLQRGLLGDDVICQKTLDFFCELYENMLGDVIVQTMPFGGIYLFGGLTQSITSHMIKRKESGQFMKQYRLERPFFDNIFDRVPIFIILKDELGLEGAYQTALRLQERGMSGHHI